MEIASGIGGVLGLVTSTIVSFNNLIGRYGMLDDTAPLIVSTCETTRRCLKQIQDEMKRNSAYYSSNEDCRALLHTTLAGCSSILRVLSLEMNTIQVQMTSTNRTSLTRKQKLKILWNWDKLKELLETLKEQKANLNLVLTVIQNDKLNRIEQLLLRKQTLVSTASNSYRLLFDKTGQTSEITSNAEDADTGSIFRFTLETRNNSSIYPSPSRPPIEAPRDRASIGLRARSTGLPRARPPSGEASQALDPIFKALEERDYERLETLCQTTDQSLKDDRGHTILSAAVHLDDIQACRIILKYDHGVEARCSFNICRGCRPIHIAAMNGSVDVIKLLLANGALLQGVSQADRTALHWAAEYDAPETFGFLLKRRLSVWNEDKDSDTVLHVVARSHALGVLRVISRNAPKVFRRQLKRKNMLRQSPLQICIDTDWQEGLELIMDGLENPTREDCSRLNWLHYAAFAGAHRVIPLLLDRGFEVNCCDRYGYTASHYAALSDNDAAKTLRILHNHGADPDAHFPRSHRARSELGTDRMFGHDFSNENFVEEYYKLCDADWASKATVLHIAAQQADLDVVQQLLAFDADARAVNSCGCNVLKLARSNKDHEIFLKIYQHLLMTHNTLMQDHSGKILALACATSRDFNEIYNRIQTASPGARNSTKLPTDQSCECGPYSHELLKFAIANNPSPVANNEYLQGCSPLRYCFFNENYEAVIALAKTRHPGSQLLGEEMNGAHDALLLAHHRPAPINVINAIRDAYPEIANVVYEKVDKLEREKKESVEKKHEKKRLREAEMASWQREQWERPFWGGKEGEQWERPLREGREGEQWERPLKEGREGEHWESLLRGRISLAWSNLLVGLTVFVGMFYLVVMYLVFPILHWCNSGGILAVLGKWLLLSYSVCLSAILLSA
jgi:ankyrin repeat protein